MKTIEYFNRSINVFYNESIDHIATDRGTQTVREKTISAVEFNGRDITRLVDLNKIIEEI